MAVVKGAPRPNPKLAKARSGWNATRRAVGANLGQRWCPWCKPGHWVANKQWDDHYEQVKFALEQHRLARAQATKTAETKPKLEVVRPERPKNNTKSAPAVQKEPAVSSTNGNGTAPAPQATMSTTAPESIAEAFRLWAIVVPPSIPGARRDAQAMADMYRQAADSLRLRMRTEAEQNNLPENVMEPLQQAATALSHLGDLHMEVVRRIELRYGEVADVLSRPDTPNAQYLAGGR